MSDSNLKEGKGAGKTRCRSWTFWRCLRWSCRVVALVAIVTVVAGFFARGWLTDRAVEYVEERLNRQGIFFNHGPVSYQIARGLVIEDLVLFETEAKKQPFLKVSNIGMDFGLSSLLLGEDLKVKEIELSVNRGFLKLYDGEEVAEIRRLQAFGKSTPQWIQIHSAEGLMNGVEVRATADFRTQKRERDPGQKDARPRKRPNFAWLRKLGNWIDFESEKKPPVLKLDVAVDKRDGAAEPIRVVGQVTGVNTRWKGLPLDKIDGKFEVTWSDKVIDVSEAKVVYRGKPIEGKMRYDLDPKVLEVERLVSEADLGALLGEAPINLGDKVEWIRVTELPRLFFSGRVTPSDLFSSSFLATCESEGALTIGQGESALPLKLLSGGVRYASGVVSTEELAVGLFGGRANVAGALNLVEKPTVYEGGVSFAGIPLAAVMTHFGKDGSWPGIISGSFAGMGGLALDTMEGTGDLQLESEAVKMQGPYSLNDAIVATDGLMVEFGGGAAAVAGRVDLKATPPSFDSAINMSSISLQSILDLAGVEKQVSGNLSGQFRSSGQGKLESISGNGDFTLADETYEVSGPVSMENQVVSLDGVTAKYGGGVAMAKGRLNTAATPIFYEGELSLESMPVQSLLNLAKVEKEMSGNLSGRFTGAGNAKLESIEGSGELRFVEETYQVEGPFALKGGIAETQGLLVLMGGGRIGVKGKTDLIASPRSWEGGVSLEGVSVQSLIELSGTDRDVEGKAYGNFSGSGSDTLSALNGAGSVRIQDGKLYSVPLIGQMRSVIVGVLPTFGKVQKSDLEATFTVNEGILNTTDLVAASDMTRVEVEGDLNLVERTADFSAQAKVDGVVGVATNVVSRLLEFEASGPVDDLDIRLKNKPVDMAAGAVKGTVGMAKEGVGMAKDGVTGLTKGARNVGEGAVRAGTGGVKMVGKGIGKLLGKKKKGERKNEDPPITPPVDPPPPVSEGPDKPGPTPAPAPPVTPAPASATP